MDGRVINKQHPNVLNFMAPFSLTDLGDTITSEIDDATTIKRNSKLKTELTKPKWNSKVVLELLKITFMQRRKAMLKVDGTNRIKKSLEEYRCLSHQEEVSIKKISISLP